MTFRELKNLSRLGSLHPEFVPIVQLLLTRFQIAGQHPLIVQARRTIAEQDAIYEQGRSLPGKIVTNARGGESYHNYGLAIDVLDIGASGDPEQYEQSDWDKTDYAAWPALAGSIVGVSWGTSWKHNDMPHIEWHPGFGPSDAFLLMPLSDNGYLPEHFFRDRGANA